MALENAVIQQKLIDQFGLKVSEFVQLHDVLTFEVASGCYCRSHEILKRRRYVAFQLFNRCLRGALSRI